MNRLLLLPALLLALPAAGYEVIEVKEGGQISGVVRLSKPPPKPHNHVVPEPFSACGSSIPDERYVVGPDRELAGVVVYLQKIKAGKKFAATRATLVNHECRYKPHVTTVPAGGKIVIENQDATFHTTHAYAGKETLFNVALPSKGMKVQQSVHRPGLVRFACDAGHTWMGAWVYVSEHPYVAVTGRDGSFVLADVPPGRYKLKAWHESEGEKSARVKLKPGATATVDFAF